MRAGDHDDAPDGWNAMTDETREETANPVTAKWTSAVTGNHYSVTECGCMKVVDKNGVALEAAPWERCTVHGGKYDPTDS